MKQRSSFKSGIAIGLLLVWGIVAPVGAYFFGQTKGFKQGMWFAGEEWKKTAVAAAGDLKKTAGAATTMVMNSMTSAGISISGGTSALASGLSDHTGRVVSGLGDSLASATGTVTSYTADLGGDLKDSAIGAGSRVKFEALRARDAVARRTDGLGDSLSSATESVTSYTAELGGDLKDSAFGAGSRMKFEARRAKDAVARRTDGLVTGVRERVSNIMADDEAPTSSSATDPG